MEAQYTKSGTLNDPGIRGWIDCWCVCVHAHLVAHSGLTFCDPVDCSPPGSSIYGIFQVRILEWLVISFFRGSSWPRDWSNISCIGIRTLYHSVIRKAWIESRCLVVISLMFSNDAIPHLADARKFHPFSYSLTTMNRRFSLYLKVCLCVNDYLESHPRRCGLRVLIFTRAQNTVI